MFNRTILVKVDLLGGRKEDDPSFLRGVVPNLGVLIRLHPLDFVVNAPLRFQSLARLRNRGKNVDPENSHVNIASDMFLRVNVSI